MVSFGRVGLRFGIAMALLLVLLVPGVGAYTIGGYGFENATAHTITNPGGVALSYYQVPFTLSNATGVHSGDTIYTNGTTQSDWRDVRFTDATGTVYPHWVESTNATCAYVWVNVTSIPSDGTTLRCYYNSVTAPQTSNGNATFPFFDDFLGASLDTVTNWTLTDTGTGTAVVSGGVLNLTAGATDNYVQLDSKSTFASGTAILMRLKSDTYTEVGSWGYATGGENAFRFGTTIGYLNQYAANSYVSAEEKTALGAGYTGYHIWEIARVATTSNKYSIDGSLVATHTVQKSSTAKAIGILVYTTGDVIEIDWIAVRNYAATAPTHGGYAPLSPPVASFSANATSGTAPLTVAFTDATVTDPSAWNWSFGDGSYSSSQSPVHTYAAAGNYTVTLNVTNATGYDLETKVDYINVTAAPSGRYTIDGYGFENGTSHRIDGVAGTTLSYYVMPMYVSNATGVNSGGTIYTNGTTQPDWRDLRFTDTSDTVYPHWVESTNATCAYVWVNVTSIPATGTTLGTYYNSSTAPQTSNGTRTFPLFDTFDGAAVDASLWTTVNSPSVAGGVLTLSDAGDEAIASTADYRGSVVGARFRTTSGSTNWGGVSAGDNLGVTRVASDGFLHFTDMNSGHLTAIESLAHGTWARYEVQASSNTIRARKIAETTAWTTQAKVPSGSNAKIGAYSVATTALEVDFIYVRPYAETEPVHGQYGDVGVPTANFSVNTTVGTPPFAVQFTDTSTNTPTSWTWVWGDGTANGTTQNPTHTYTADGTYSVTMIAANSNGSDDEVKTNYIVTGNAIDGFAFSNGTEHTIANPGGVALSYYQIPFTLSNATGVNSGGTIYTSGTTQPDWRDIRFTDATDAVYPHCVEWTNATCAYVWVNVTSIPTGNSTMRLYYGSLTAPQVSNGDATFVFYDGFSSLNTSKWDTAGSPAIVSDSVQLGGSESEHLASKQAFGTNVILESVTYLDSVSAHEFGFEGSYDGLPVEKFQYGYPTVSVYNARTYVSGEKSTNLGSISLGARSWTITRVGSTSVVFSVSGSTVATHTEQIPTTDMKIVVGQPPGLSAGLSTVDWIRVRNYAAVEPTHGGYSDIHPPAAPVANFTANVTIGASPLAVEFTVVYVGGGDATAWYWDIDNDGDVDYTTQNCTHTYSDNGNYSVNYTASNFFGTSTMIKDDYIVVGNPPSTNFTGAPRAGAAPLSVQFNDTSTGEPTAWNWSFGDTAYSDERNATHDYAAGGLYSVRLNASNAYGSYALTRTNYITAIGPSPYTIDGYGFDNATSHTITNPGGVALSYYQVPFILSNVTGTNSGDTIYTDGTTQPDWRDIRFTDATDVVYPHWVEWTNATCAYVWVNITSIPEAGTTLRCYYNSSTAPQTSDGDTTFPFFDDFPDSTLNTSKWTDASSNSATASISGSVVTLSTTGAISTAVIYGKTAFGTGYALRARTKTSHVGAVSQCTGIQFVETTSQVGMHIRPSWVSLWDKKYTNFDGGLTSVGITTWDAGTWYTAELKRGPSSGIYQIDGQEAVEIGGNYYTGSDCVPYFQAYMSSDTGVPATTDVDWVAVRNYTATEPTHGGYAPLGQPVAAFSANVTSGTAPLTVAFTDESTGDPTSWTWVWGDSTANGTTQSPAHTYTSAGTYTVTLIAANGDGSDDEVKSNYITVTGAQVAPVAAFTSNVTSGADPLTVAFTDATVTDPTAWNWSFGDGSYSTDQNPVHTYADAGTYSVSLNASNATGYDVETKTGYISIGVAPVAAFYGNETVAAVPHAVAFTDTSTGATSWSWDFGDGSPPSTEQSPTHTYTSVGVYTVTLTVENAYDTDSEIKAGYINVGTGPSAAFTANRTLSHVGDGAIQFTDTSTDATAWTWTFGDGTPNAETQNPIHVYGAVGTYSVTLTVENAYDADTETKVAYIDIGGVPVPAFSGTPRVGAPPLAVQFTDTSTGSPTAWSWNFGDGSSLSTDQNPSHSYAAVGAYRVCLTATNLYGSATTFVNSYVDVGIPPVADFNGFPQSGATPLDVEFADASTGSPTAWSWNFGDGSTPSTLQDPTHRYAAAGTYVVALTVSNAYGSDTETKAAYVTVGTAPTAAFSADTTGVQVGDTVTFTDASTGSLPMTAWTWDFGDGSAVSHAQNPTHAYAVGGTFTVSLSVANAWGVDSEVKTGYIYVGSGANASFTGMPLTGEAPIAVQFTDTSAGATAWSWTFGDGSPSSIEQNPSHTYAANGLYTVVLTATNQFGGTMVTKTNYVIVGPLTATHLKAAFKMNVKTGPEPLTVQFTDTSKFAVGSGAYALAWDFGDGNVSSEANPVHVYADDGKYDVELAIMSHEETDTVTQEKAIYVYPSQALAPHATTTFAIYATQMANTSFDPIKIAEILPSAYTDLIPSTVFWGLIFAVIFFMIWIRNGNVTLVAILGIIFAGCLMSFIDLPPEWSRIAQIFMAIAIAAMFFTALMGRRR